MKRILLMLTVVAASALTMYGQGRINFNNLVSGNTDTITVSGQRNAAEGAAGAFLGSQYTIQLLWGTAGTTYPNVAAFLAANPSSSTPFPFFGTTGGNPATDGAGFFDGGTVAIGAAGTYTMLARAWYNGGTVATYDLALVGLHNVGDSGLFSANVTAAPTPAGNTTFPSFTVQVVPEPSTMALAGLGAAALLIFRRRK